MDYDNKTIADIIQLQWERIIEMRLVEKKKFDYAPIVGDEMLKLCEMYQYSIMVSMRVMLAMKMKEDLEKNAPEMVNFNLDDITVKKPN